MEFSRKEIQKIKEDADYIFNHRDDCPNKNSSTPIDECYCDCHEFWWLSKGAELMKSKVLLELSLNDANEPSERPGEPSITVTKVKDGLGEHYISALDRPLSGYDLVVSKAIAMIKEILK